MPIMDGKKKKDVAQLMDQGQMRAFQSVDFSPRLFTVDQAQEWLDAHEIPAKAIQRDFGIMADLFSPDRCIVGTFRAFQMDEGVTGWKCDQKV